MELTIEELEKLLKISYNKGYRDGKNSNTHTISTPYIYDPPITIKSSGGPLREYQITTSNNK